MAKYKIYMVKLGTPHVGSESQISTALKGLFDQVIQSNRGLSTRFSEGAEVTWMTSCPSPATHELLIYVLANSMDSIVRSMPGISGTPGTLDSDGLTVWTGSLSASEVYTNNLGSNAAMMAKLAFHEAMHNKTRSGAALHGGDGLAVSPLSPASSLSPGNIRTMARVLGSAKAQWAGGCSAYNDPLRGVL